MTLREHVAALRARINLPDLSKHVDIHDAFTFGGLALLTIGAADVWQPLGFIVPGGFFMWLGVQGAK